MDNSKYGGIFQSAVENGCIIYAGTTDDNLHAWRVNPGNDSTIEIKNLIDTASSSYIRMLDSYTPHDLPSHIAKAFLIAGVKYVICCAMEVKTRNQRRGVIIFEGKPSK